MYGFPQELYDLKYPVKGNAELTAEVQKLLGDAVSVNDEWESIMERGRFWCICSRKRIFLVAQLSVSRLLSAQESYELGRKRPRCVKRES